MHIFCFLVLTIFKASGFPQQAGFFQARNLAWAKVSSSWMTPVLPGAPSLYFIDPGFVIQRAAKEPGRTNIHSACPAAVQRYEFSHPQMGTIFRLVFYSDQDSVAAAAIAARVFTRMDTLNAIFSDYLPESELNRLSDRAGHPEPVPVSAELADILRRACRYSKATDGAFDVTVGALTRLWRRAFHLQELPDSARIAVARATADWRGIRFRGASGVRLVRPGTRLDLGGIAAGYAADECIRLLRAAGIRRALADAGGDIALGDAPPDAAGWQIEIPVADPDGQTGFAPRPFANCGITTSGATYKYLDVNGVRYSHIVDPKTGYGLTHRNLVCVQAPDATTADAWATAISVAGETKWKKWKKRHPELKVWVVEMML